MNRPLALTLALCLCLSLAHANPPRAARERASKAVVEIRALEELPVGTFSVRGVTFDGKRYQEGRSSGSGTIISPAGVILTAAHVVANVNTNTSSIINTARGPLTPAALVEVRITNRIDEAARPAYLARVMRFDAKHDLAALQIVADIKGAVISNLNLPALEMGSSEDLVLGDELSLIGYPISGGRTITFTGGRVSGFVGEDYVSAGRAFIKTDARFSSGASGGAALDENGKLIGVPIAIAFDRKGGVPQESQNYLRPVAFALELLRDNNTASNGASVGPEPTTTP